MCRSGSASSAVYRFCDKMKLAGYGELKRRLAADLYDYMHEKEFDYDFPVQKGQSMLQIVSGIKEDYLNTIDATMDYKVPLLLICSPNMKDIESDYILYFSPHEDHADKVSSFSRRLSLLFLLDMLYAGYFAADYDNNLEKRKRFYQKMTRYT